jgi:hypothetical protein
MRLPGESGSITKYIDLLSGHVQTVTSLHVFTLVYYPRRLFHNLIVHPGTRESSPLDNNHLRQARTEVLAAMT